MDFPKVLHVGTVPIGSPGNSGLTLGSLFGEWPADHLLQLLVGSPAAHAAPDLVVAPASIAPLDKIVRRIAGRRLSPSSGDGLNRSVSRKSQTVSPGLRLRLSASALNDIGPVRLPDSLIGRLAAFEPTVVHSLLGSVRQMRIVHKVSVLLDVPIVPHFMDDWADTLFTDGQLLGLGRRAVEARLREVLDRSPICLAVGEDMAREYAERFGRRFVAVGNCVDVERYRALRPQRLASPAPRRLRYVGGLHLGRAAVIEAVARAIRPGSDGRDWVVELFVPTEHAGLARSLARSFSRVRYGGSLSPSEVAQTLVDADALIFIESSDPDIFRFTRLSVSTKVPQYLAAGRPVLVFGPAEQASVRVLVESGAGHFAGDGTRADVVVTALDTLGSSDGLGENVLPAERAEWIAARFGMAEARERLLRALAVAGAPDL